MPFITSVLVCLSKPFTFSGRARRSEYWWFVLFETLVNIVFAVATGIAFAIHDKLGLAVSLLSWLVQLALSILTLAAGSRRLHDTNRSGWWQLLYLTGIGVIPLFIWSVKEGERGPNRYGPPTK